MTRGGNQLQVAGQHEQVDLVARRARRATRPAVAGSVQDLGGTPCARARVSAAGVRPVAQDQHHPRGRSGAPGRAAAPRGCCRAPRRPRPRASSWPGKVIGSPGPDGAAGPTGLIAKPESQLPPRPGPAAARNGAARRPVPGTMPRPPSAVARLDCRAAGRRPTSWPSGRSPDRRRRAGRAGGRACGTRTGR